MERIVKRPKLNGDTSGDASQIAEASRHYRNSDLLSNNSFRGKGVQNAGNLKVGRDLTITINQKPTPGTETSDDRKELFDSLVFEKMTERVTHVRMAYGGTCGWFLQEPAYTNWMQASVAHDDDKLLWIKGKPGAGKSTLMKFMLQQLGNRVRQTGNQEVLISFFFHARGYGLQKTTVGLYQSLLRQLLEKCPNLQYVLDGFRVGHSWTIESLESAFKEAIQGLGDTSLFCLIDALDECNDEEVRGVVSFFNDPDIIQKKVHICYTSRQYPTITSKRGHSVILESQAGHRKDIASYINSKLTIQDGSLAEQIRCDLQKKASGVFMWVVLVVDILNEECDNGRAHSLRAKIEEFPQDIYDLFLNILTRDDESKRSKNKDGLLLCIQWVLFARQPLTLKQLFFAIISQLEPNNLASCHSSDVSEDQMKKYINNNSRGLAELTGSENPTVQFIHESVRDFFLEKEGFTKIWPGLSGAFTGQSHNTLKQCCLTYMSMNEVADFTGWPAKGATKEFIKKIIQQFPFLQYANSGVLYHADRAQQHGVEQAQFLNMFPKFKWVKHHNALQEHQINHHQPEVSLLYILAGNNTPYLIHALESRQFSFDLEKRKKIERYGVPFLAAIATKSKEAAEALIKIETEGWIKDPVLEDIRGLDTLEASSGAFEWKKYSYYQKTLPQLIDFGNEKAALIFLHRNQCVLTGDGMSLVSAVDKGFNRLVKWLLKKGAHDLWRNDRNLLFEGNDHGQTPLWTASSKGYVKIARDLISYRANVLTPDKGGRTPLHVASLHGHVEVVRLLIDKGANTSAVDRHGRTPLWMASSNGHTEIVELLEGRNGAQA
ncbi:hypothetical protein F5Y10DRAFT_293015 [Nemania abortiva]|nr:hypothetical protein F5Y10DRAFT_293015 [Nemania abortiva]